MGLLLSRSHLHDENNACSPQSALYTHRIFTDHAWSRLREEHRKNVYFVKKFPYFEIMLDGIKANLKLRKLERTH